MKIIGIISLVFIGMFALGWIGIAMKWIALPGHAANNQVNLFHDAIDQTINAENAIYNYEWFKQKYQDIEATKRQYEVAQKNYKSYLTMLGSDRSTWGFEDKNEVARLNAVQLGLLTNLEGQIGDYNARASMATRNIFEDSVLPSFIDALTFVTK